MLVIDKKDVNHFILYLPRRCVLSLITPFKECIYLFLWGVRVLVVDEKDVNHFTLYLPRERQRLRFSRSPSARASDS